MAPASIGVSGTGGASSSALKLPSLAERGVWPAFDRVLDDFASPPKAARGSFGPWGPPGGAAAGSGCSSHHAKVTRMRRRF